MVWEYIVCAVIPSMGVWNETNIVFPVDEKSKWYSDNRWPSLIMWYFLVTGCVCRPRVYTGVGLVYLPLCLCVCDENPVSMMRWTCSHHVSPDPRCTSREERQARLKRRFRSYGFRETSGRTERSGSHEEESTGTGQTAGTDLRWDHGEYFSITSGSVPSIYRLWYTFMYLYLCLCLSISISISVGINWNLALPQECSFINLLAYYSLPVHGSQLQQPCSLSKAPPLP